MRSTKGIQKLAEEDFLRGQWCFAPDYVSVYTQTCVYVYTVLQFLDTRFGKVQMIVYVSCFASCMALAGPSCTYSLKLVASTLTTIAMQTLIVNVL